MRLESAIYVYLGMGRHYNMREMPIMRTFSLVG